MRGWASSAIAMHSSRGSTLATTAGGLGVGAGGIWAHAAVSWKATAAGTRMKSRRRTFIRPENITAGGQTVDTRWIPFFLTAATFCVLESRSPQDIGGSG